LWRHELGVFAADFSEQGDEFEYHLRAEFGQIGMSGRGTDGTCPVVLGPPQDPSITSTLEISAHVDGILCVVVGAKDDPEESRGQVEPWSRAISAAVAALGHRDTPHIWQAVIGTAPFTYGPDRIGELAGPAKLGPLVLDSGGICMRERPGDHGRLDRGGGVRHSFPIIVTGGAVTYSWDHLQYLAEFLLHRTCALMTLATGELWIPRISPRQQLTPEPAVTIPATSPHDPQIAQFPMEKTPWAGQIPEGTAQFTLPEWTTTAWTALTEDTDLDGAVCAHYEAMRLYAGHSSLSYLTFVAAIEGYGKRFVPDAPCTCRPECTHQKGVAEQRFRKGLRTVMSGNQANKISKYAYSLRSTTGHQGSLLGSERFYGFEPPSLFKISFSTAFDFTMLDEIRNVSRTVLVAALKNIAESQPSK
jgi:hypothetical protein